MKAVRVPGAEIGEGHHSRQGNRKRRGRKWQYNVTEEL